MIISLPDGKLVSDSELNLLSDAATSAGALDNSEKEAPEDEIEPTSRTAF